MSLSQNLRRSLSSRSLWCRPSQFEIYLTWPGGLEGNNLSCQVGQQKYAIIIGQEIDNCRLEALALRSKITCTYYPGMLRGSGTYVMSPVYLGIFIEALHYVRRERASGPDPAMR